VEIGKKIKKMELRNYQIESIEKIKKSFAEGLNRVVLCSPTGSGKTVIFSRIAKITNENQKKVLIAVDRKELMIQTGNILRFFGVDFGVIDANSKIIPSQKTVVCMLETLKLRLKKQNYIDFVRSCDLIILDEIHKNSFNKLFEILQPNQKVVGATATPYRTGKMPELKKYYDKIIEIVKISELIEKGFLSVPKSYGIKQNLSDIDIKMGDYDEKQLSEYYNSEKIFTGISENYLKYTPNQKTLIFCVSIENSKNVCQDLKTKNLNAKHLDSTMSDLERHNILFWFKKTTNAILCNVGILTTGFDCPEIEVIILYRATKSLPLFLQMVGRGSRTTETKKKFTIFDFGNNILEHGFWEQDRIWTLDNAKVGKKKGEQVAPVKTCPQCEALIPASVQKCIFCGFEYPKKETKKTQIQIILEELSPSQIQRYADNCTVAELEEIREIKNYKIGWILHKLTNFDQFLEFEKIKGYKKGWASYNFNRYAK
jgi:superfamily II DNA or RNA helicase